MNIVKRILYGLLLLVSLPFMLAYVLIEVLKETIEYYISFIVYEEENWTSISYGDSRDYQHRCKFSDTCKNKSNRYCNKGAIGGFGNMICCYYRTDKKGKRYKVLGSDLPLTNKILIACLVVFFVFMLGMAMGMVIRLLMEVVK